MLEDSMKQVWQVWEWTAKGIRNQCLDPSYAYYLLAVWHWAGHLASLSLIFLICKMHCVPYGIFMKIP